MATTITPALRGDTLLLEGSDAVNGEALIVAASKKLQDEPTGAAAMPSGGDESPLGEDAHVIDACGRLP